MTDITKIAQACASRIMDRMEMSRGSAILKSDIEREVEIALRELIDVPKATPASIADKALKALAYAHMPEFSGLNFAVPYAGFRFRVDGDTLIHEPIPQKEMPEITVEEAEKRGIPLGAPGYVWVDRMGWSIEKAVEYA